MYSLFKLLRFVNGALTVMVLPLKVSVKSTSTSLNIFFSVEPLFTVVFEEWGIDCLDYLRFFLIFESSRKTNLKTLKLLLTTKNSNSFLSKLFYLFWEFICVGCMLPPVNYLQFFYLKYYLKFKIFYLKSAGHWNAIGINLALSETNTWFFKDYKSLYEFCNSIFSRFFFNLNQLPILFPKTVLILLKDFRECAFCYDLLQVAV